jgi:preprotein translocase subunit SecE
VPSPKERIDEVDAPEEPSSPAGPARSSRAGARAQGAPTTPAKNPVARLIDFSHECWAELQRVQWPNRRELWQATAVVIVVCALVGFYVGGLDRVFRPLSGWLIDQYAKH